MSNSPPPATHSQKRPLEDPSSPSTLVDLPEAKRPALDKVIKPDTAVPEPVIPQPVTPSAPEAAAKPESETKPAANGSGQTHPITTITSPITSTANGQSNTNSQDESKWLHVRAIISSAEAATIIGKGGENVTLVRRLSGAKCTVSDYTRGAVERILTVNGPADAVAKAFGLIVRTLNNEPLDQPSTAQSKPYPLRLLIPHILIGSIIGKGGVRIREIQEASGARLNASESTLPLSTERTLVVLGVADAVHIATYYVGSTLVEQLTERFGGPAASAYATRTGAPAGPVPGGLQVVPYVPQAAGGQWNHPDNYRRHSNVAQRGPANPYGIGYLHGQAPQPVQSGMPYSASSPRAAAAPYAAAAAPHQAGPYAHAQASAHGAPAPQPVASAIPGAPITQQIYIPNDMVGAIIGKGGQKINEIRQLSGSVIKINEPQDNSNERLVTITGTQECNQMALYMLYTRLEEKRERGRSSWYESGVNISKRDRPLAA